MDPRVLGRAIASAKAGDALGYAQLLEAYGSRLYAYFLRATGTFPKRIGKWDSLCWYLATWGAAPTCSSAPIGDMKRPSAAHATGREGS